MNIKKFMKAIIVCSAICSATTFAMSPVGYWAAKDDKTGKVLSVIQIWKTKTNVYNGRIYKIMDVVANGRRQNPKDRCKACTGALTSKPILCMQIVYNLKKSTSYSNTWSGGQVYDPQSDNTYHAKIWFSHNDNKQLHLRGYVGMPLFGRTETWKRISKPNSSRWVCNRSIANSYHK